MPGRITFHTRADGAGQAMSERLRIHSGGDVEVKTGSLIIGTAGEGIDFSATGGPNNGTGSSERLEDYEEGTWTPALAFGGNSSGISYSSRSGSYIKIGTTVYCQGQMDLTSKGSSSGDASITGLPFTVGDYVSGTSQEGSGFFSWWSNFAQTDSAPTTFWISEGGTAAAVYRTSNGANIQSQNQSHWANNTGVRIFLQYRST